MSKDFLWLRPASAITIEMGISSVPTLSLFDGFLLVLTVVSVLTAFRHGLVKVAFSVSGLIVGVLVAGSVHTWVINWLRPYVSVQLSSQIVAYLAVVLIVYGVFLLFAKVARHIATDAGLGFADRLLGAGFGLFRGALVGAIILVTVTAVMPKSTLISNSVFAPYLMSGTHAVAFMIPEEFQIQVDPYATPLIPVEPNALEAKLPDNQ